jgi:UDP-2,3-diacylglucosamine pyrophosphatase LpxH
LEGAVVNPQAVDQIDIVWIHGNHDGPAEVISHLLGVAVRDELVMESGNKRILFHHGFRFDRFLDDHPILTAVADVVYRVLQKIDPSHHVARTAKAKSKTFLRCAAEIETRSTEYARKMGCHAVCCGHTHMPSANEKGPVQYYNSGCWTEKPCHYLSVTDGRVELCSYAAETSDDVIAEITRPDERAAPVEVA